jgi:hypothetical protein
MSRAAWWYTATTVTTPTNDRLSFDSRSNAGGEVNRKIAPALVALMIVKTEKATPKQFVVDIALRSFFSLSRTNRATTARLTKPVKRKSQVAAIHRPIALAN